MNDSYVGEIRLVGFNFIPQGWLACNGQLLNLSDYPELFSVLGTTYGGDGTTTFALPNLCSRAPIGVSSGNPLGSMGGQETVTLTTAQIPPHRHSVAAQSTAGTQSVPTNAVFAASTVLNQYETSGPAATGTMLVPAGGSQPHSNLMPYLALTYIIAPVGVFPRQN